MDLMIVKEGYTDPVEKQTQWIHLSMDRRMQAYQNKYGTQSYDKSQIQDYQERSDSLDDPSDVIFDRLIKQILYPNNLPREDQLALMQAFAPLVYLHSEDPYRPGDAQTYFENCFLRNSSEEILLQELQKAGDIPLIYNQPDNHLQPKGSKNAQKNLFQGSPIENNKSTAPCYAHLVERGDKIIIHYIFFYPFDGPEVSKYLNAGKHQADWEHVDVHLEFDPLLQKYTLCEMFYVGHSSKKNGTYVDANDLEYVNGHPVVYSSLHGHASLPKDIILDKNFDRTNNKGPLWECWQNIHILSEQDWYTFRGYWGSTNRVDNVGCLNFPFPQGASPAPPIMKSWLLKEEPHDLNSITLPCKIKNSSIKVSSTFSLHHEYPRYSRQFRVDVEGTEDPEALTFAIKQKKPGCCTNPATVYQTTDGQEDLRHADILSINRNFEKHLYIANPRINGEPAPKGTKFRIKFTFISP